MDDPLFETYPWRLVIVCNAVGLAVYAIGIYVTARLGLAWVAVYASYCVAMELRLLAGSCRRCYYYGKRCGFGKGGLCARIYRRAAEPNLSEKQVAWRDIVPDLLVPLAPLAACVVLLARRFEWPIVLCIVALVFLSSAGNGYVRGQVACKRCKQRELGCPAERMFNKTGSTSQT
jgi:hypothetical protein